MSLEKELSLARKDVVTDGYDMSVGEVVSLYRDKELTINPEYQRLFRWDDGRKTRFIESILLGIPIPPIFIFQLDTGVWELVDGLQRVSTLLEFMGLLVDGDGKKVPPSSLDGTALLPSLAHHSWDAMPGNRSLTPAQKLDIKRARLRVEILKRESDPSAKFELFQRLNTGGASLSRQEVRNCTIVMIDPKFFKWLKGLADDKAFQDSIDITDSQRDQQFHVELVLRLLAAYQYPYTPGRDVHDYLDDAALTLVRDGSLSRTAFSKLFSDTFGVIREAFQGPAFRRWSGTGFTGKFLLSVFEVVAFGTLQNSRKLLRLSASRRSKFIKEQAQKLWVDQTFKKYSGAGVRGSDRIGALLPMAKKFMNP